MPKPYLLLTILWCICLRCIYAQDPSFIGPVSYSLANLRSLDHSPWAVFNNASLTTESRNYSGAIAYQNRFLIKELGARAIALNVPSNLGVFSGAVLQSGYSKSLLSRYGLSFSKSFGPQTAAFFQYNYISHHFEAADRSDGFYSAFGLHQKVSKAVELGVLIENAEQAKISMGQSTYAIPSIYCLGVQWNNGSWANVFAEVEKEMDYELVYKCAIELDVSDVVKLRCGVRGKPVELSFGAGFLISKLIVDAAFSYHRQLGLSSCLGLQYSIDRKVR